jgi:hypothetical protein
VQSVGEHGECERGRGPAAEKGRQGMAERGEAPRHDDPTEIKPRPRPVSDGGPGATAAQLKRDITSGATGDKVAVFDPGAADIGTDAEAAGTPMTPEMIELARKTERMNNPPTGDPGERANAVVGPRLLVALLAAVALGLGAALIGFR